MYCAKQKQNTIEVSITTVQYVDVKSIAYLDSKLNLDRWLNLNSWLNLDSRLNLDN